MSNVSIRCVGYFSPDDDLWYAVALDMDLIAEGRTLEAARAELDELIQMQVSFAAFKGDMSMIWKSAPPKYWAMYEEVRRNYVARALGIDGSDDNASIDDLPFPDPHVIKEMQQQFVGA